MEPKQQIEHILDEALSRYAAGEAVEQIAAAFPGHQREVEDLLITVRALQLDRDRVEVPKETLRAALVSGSVTEAETARYTVAEDYTKGRVLAGEAPTEPLHMWKILTPVAAVIAVVLVVVAMRQGAPTSMLSSSSQDSDEVAFNEAAGSMDSYFESEQELMLAIDAAEGTGSAAAVAPASADPLDSAGLEADAAAANNLQMEQFLNEQNGLEGDMNF